MIRLIHFSILLTLIAICLCFISREAVVLILTLLVAAFGLALADLFLK